MPDLMRRTPIKRTPFGKKKRVTVQSEKQQATVLEGGTDRLGLFYLHRVDWRHIDAPMSSVGSLKSGEPDYLLLGDGWLAFLELKARNLETNRPGSMSAAQHSFHAKLKRAGAEVWTATLPDDLQAVNLWLREKTGIVVSIDGLLA